MLIKIKKKRYNNRYIVFLLLYINLFLSTIIGIWLVFTQNYFYT